ncbi:unnamed protein product [Thelazia callipaeda]|uniref:Uncharacterized protein n=1 Tax=Thelazia callipaeda TaxID=103827 RepID=A0A0N5DBP4_THECL|nr:unnamed protein product [Thelazia callipaeda]
MDGKWVGVIRGRCISLFSSLEGIMAADDVKREEITNNNDDYNGEGINERTKMAEHIAAVHLFLSDRVRCTAR